jgi:hypothetical protein
MSAQREALKHEASACLRQNKPAGELVDCIGKAFPRIDAYREKDDLVLKSGGPFLIVRRSGVDRFRVSENIAVP